MKECNKIMEKVLSGERTAEVEIHLKKCISCRSLAELAGELEKMPGENASVPPALDQAILGYASQKQKERMKEKNLLHFAARFVLPLAAAAAFCISIPFVLQQEENSREVTVNRSGKTAALSSYEPDQMNLELLLISSNIQESSDRLTRTAAFSAAFDSYK